MGDTIFAAAAGGSRAALTVLRISGGATGALLEALCGTCPAPRRASLRRIRGSDGDVLDQALVLWFPAPGSYTGEDSAELHLHGGVAVFEAVSAALVAAGLRPAEPGEFTRRAFLNGRMDLLEAEAVADLVDAESDSQRQQALRQLDGAQGRLYGGWADRLLRLMAQQEALIDFPDEDLPPETMATAQAEIAALRAEVGTYLNDGQRGERLRDGLVFAVVGPPNVGKSSLVNALAGRDVAIVAASPGTTRDVVETPLLLGGAKVFLLDTAGLREAADPVEAEGIRRARSRAASADLAIVVSDGQAAMTDAASAYPNRLHVANKADLGRPSTPDAVAVSARTGAGMADLRAALADAAHRLTQAAGPPPLTRARHRAALTEMCARLDAARHAGLAELRAEDLRLAVRSLGRITGAVGVEDVLDSVFRQFCIGK